MKNNFLALSILLIGALSLASCVKKEFDAPPNQSTNDPQLKVTNSIAELNTFTTNKEITDDIIIYGIVTADDRSGNFYKQIVIEDSTGGIALLLDQNSLYNDYPIGRKVYVRCKGLYVGNYNDIPQLGYTPDNTNALTNIPASLISSYVIRANYPNTLTPKVVTLEQVKYTDPALINRLITIDGVQFDSLSTYKKYADPAPVSGTSRTIVDCDKNSIILRTSGYAAFQPFLTPSGRGSITAIYTSYKGTPQLVIRDTNDIKFYDTRCGGTPGTPPPPPPPSIPMVSVDSVRKIYNGKDVTLGQYTIKGVVISDKIGNNTTTGKSLTLQDGNRGITVFFTGNHSYYVGDSITIDVTGTILTSFNGTLEISNVALGSSEKVGTGKITPKTLTIADLMNNIDDYQSCLVRFTNTTLSGGTTYLGSRTLSDGSGTTLVAYTYSSAVFANSPLPTTPKTVTGIVSQYNTTTQLIIRNATDVQ